MTESARQLIDADGPLVTPGCVDIHTHYDGQVTWDTLLSPRPGTASPPWSWATAAWASRPCARATATALIELMEGVEDIPGTALTRASAGWESFPEYLDALDAAPDASTSAPRCRTARCGST